MYALLMLVVHAVVSSLAALAIAPYSLDAAATSRSLWMLSMASALLSTIGLAATATYLSRRIRPLSGVQVGLLCGLVCAGLEGLALRGIGFSLVLYLVLLVPTLVAVLMASLLERPKSGWQT
jgi:hypothetical protein